MAAPLTPAQREEYGARVYARSMQGFSASQIAAELNISNTTVDSLLKRERKQRWAGLDQEQQNVLAQFEGEQRSIMADAWRRLEIVDPEGRTAPDLQSNVLTASLNIAKAKGALVDRRELTGAGGKDLFADLRAVMLTPVQVIVSDGEDPFDSCEPTP